MKEEHTSRHLPSCWAAPLSWVLPLAAILSGFIPRDRSRYLMNPPFHDSMRDQLLNAIPTVVVPLGLALGVLCLTIWRRHLCKASRIQAISGLVLVALLGILMAVLFIFGESVQTDIIDFY